MAVSNLVRVRDNIQKMVDQGAPGEDIDGYLKTEGYTPDKFKTALGKYQQQVKSVDYGAGSEMLSGLTFGFADELRSRMTGEPIEAIRESQAGYRQESPGASTAANIAGSLPTLLIPGAGAANVLRGAGMAGKAARALGTVGTGAAYGGLTGAGEAVEGERGAGAARGAATGAIAAPVGAALGRGVQAVAQRRATNLPADLQAQAIAAGKLRAAGITPQEAQQRLAQGQTIAELAKPLETTAGAVVRRSPEAAARYAEIAATRKAARPEQLMQAVQKEVTGGEAPTLRQIEQMTTQQRAASKPYYDQAFAEAEPIQSPLIDDLMTLEPFQMAYKRAQAIAKLERNPIPEYQPGQPISLRAANYIKQGLDEVVYGAKRDPSSSIGKTQIGLIDQLRGDFVREVDTMAPESYRMARSIYAGGARNQEAADAGAQAWKQGPEYVSDFMSRASEAEKQAFRAAANAELQKVQAGLGSNREAFRALMDTPKSQQVVQQLSQIEGPSAVPFLARQQKQQAEFDTRMTGGSQTAERRVADEMLGEESLPVQIARQGPMGALYNATIQKAVDVAQTGGNKTVQGLGDILLNPEHAANVETLRRLGLLEDQLKRQAGVRAGSYAAGAGLSGGLLGGQ